MKHIPEVCPWKSSTVIKGDLDVNGEKLSPGGGASTDEEKELHFASEKGAHFLLFDLH